MDNLCKRCLLHESAGGNILEDIKSKIASLSADEKATAETYGKRLALCKDCDELISGVCMKCGCYVEFRAAFKSQKCPNVKDRKW